MSDASNTVSNFVEVWSDYKFSESIHPTFFGIAASRSGNGATIIAASYVADVLNSLPALVKELEEAKERGDHLQLCLTQDNDKLDATTADLAATRQRCERLEKALLYMREQAKGFTECFATIEMRSVMDEALNQ